METVHRGRPSCSETTNAVGSSGKMSPPTNSVSTCVGVCTVRSKARLDDSEPKKQRHSKNRVHTVTMALKAIARQGRRLDLRSFSVAGAGREGEGGGGLECRFSLAVADAVVEVVELLEEVEETDKLVFRRSRILIIDGIKPQTLTNPVLVADWVSHCRPAGRCSDVARQTESG